MDIKWIGNRQYMKMNRQGDVIYLSFRSLDALPWLLNAFTTRMGGVSEGEYASMNLAFRRGDDLARVRENYRILGEALGFHPSRIVNSEQEHTTNVLRVTKKDTGLGHVSHPAYEHYDGFITDEPGVVLMTYFADCVPLYFVDPEHRAIGLSHSGWRGTASGMARATIQAMKKEFGSDPSKMLAAIGPSICQKCYTVNGDVARQFMNCYYYESGPDQFQLDLQEANRGMMVSEGIPYDAISMPDLCTACNPDFLFSHRASKGRRGTLAAVLGIREEWKHPRFGTPL